jgi:LAO/AO transport system kinase
MPAKRAFPKRDLPKPNPLKRGQPDRTLGASDTDKLVKAVIDGDRRALAQAITLVESTRLADRAGADALLNALLPHSGRSIRIGVTGLPGVGKSSLIEVVGLHAIELGHRVAVLAVDPSSSLSGGSILGDKTRMQELARNDRAFVRPSPTGGTLGGVARRTREAMLLCEAAGYDVILVETVGVGQSETAVADMSDMFLLMLLPGAGDELQGLKRGVVEMADAILINKADGDLADQATRTAADYRAALGFLRPTSNEWSVSVSTCSMATGDGVLNIWSLIGRFREVFGASGDIARRRALQANTWMWSEVGEGLKEALKANSEVRGVLPAIETDVSEGRRAPTVAAHLLLEAFCRSN